MTTRSTGRIHALLFGLSQDLAGELLRPLAKLCSNIQSVDGDVESETLSAACRIRRRKLSSAEQTLNGHQAPADQAGSADRSRQPASRKFPDGWIPLKPAPLTTAPPHLKPRNSSGFWRPACAHSEPPFPLSSQIYPASILEGTQELSPLPVSASVARSPPNFISTDHLGGQACDTCVSRPVSGVVSVQQLLHKRSKKARKAFGHRSSPGKRRFSTLAAVARRGGSSGSRIRRGAKASLGTRYVSDRAVRGRQQMLRTCTSGCPANRVFE